MTVIGSLVHYLLKFVILMTAAGLGIFAGKKADDRRSAKRAADREAEEVK